MVTLVNNDERDSEGERKPSPRRVVQFPWVDSEEEKERTKRGFLSRKLRKIAKMTERNRQQEVDRQQAVDEVTTAGNWIRNRANNRRMYELYNEHKQFRYHLDILLQQRDRPPLFAWWGQFQEVIKLCFNPSLNPARLEEFRQEVDLRVFTEEEKVELRMLYSYLFLIGENIRQPSAENSSSDNNSGGSANSTSNTGYEGGDEK